MWWFISNIFHVHPDVWEKDEPILTNMFFKGVGSTTNHQPQKWGDFPYLDPPLGVFEKKKIRSWLTEVTKELRVRSGEISMRNLFQTEKII